ncbi:MAG: hypothetical protein Greene07147_882 [Parcubacteria group bacterium Greene0714_7]|nr:MAG: hypothetical protein Greene07147_882 [Parcubacteria group bacterium Greene0714_7]
MYGASQTTAALTDAGVTTGMLALNSSGSAAGNGGTLTFGNAQSVAAGSVGFAAIKGLLTNGTTNTIGDLAFSTRNAVSDTALTERMRILASGNVGIGTASPGEKLSVVVSAAGTSAKFTDGTNSSLFIKHPSSGLLNFDMDSGNQLSFSDGGVENIRINGSGFLGIASTSPRIIFSR